MQSLIVDLLSPSKEGNVVLLRELLQSMPTDDAVINLNINRADDRGYTALHHSCELGNVECVSALLEHSGIDMSLQTNPTRNVECVSALLDYSGIDVPLQTNIDVPLQTISDTFCHGMNTALHLAVKSGSIKCLSMLLAHRSCRSIFQRNEGGYTPIECAVERGHAECLSQLLAKSVCESLYPALLIAAMKNSAECMSQLINHPRIQFVCGKDAQGYTAIHHASQSGSVQCLSLLLQHPTADVSIQSNECKCKTKKRINGLRTALHLAARAGSVECMSLLINHPSFVMDVFFQDQFEYTSLHCAVLSKSLKCVSFLLSYPHADVSLQCYNNHYWDEPTGTALHLAAIGGWSEGLLLLLQHSSVKDVFIKNSYGFTAVEYAITVRSNECILALLEHPSAKAYLQTKNISTSRYLQEMDDALAACNLHYYHKKFRNLQNDRYSQTMDDERTLSDFVGASTLETGIDMSSCSSSSAEAEAPTYGSSNPSLIFENKEDVSREIQIAAISGSLECLVLLLGHPTADVTLVNNGIDKEIICKREWWGPDKWDFSGTALHFAAAAKCNSVECISLLLHQPSTDVSIQNMSNLTAIDVAIVFGRARCLSLLLQHHTCPKVDFMAVIKKLFDQDDDKYYASETLGCNIGRYPTKYRSCYYLETQACLLAVLQHPNVLNQNINKKDLDGNNILHRATVHGFAECVSFIIQHPFLRINDRNDDGFTAIHLSVYYDNLECLSLLSQHPKCYDVNVKDNFGFTPLHVATDHRNVSCLGILLNHPSADIRIQDEYGFTPLHIAAFHLDLVSFSLLSQHSSCDDINIKDARGNTILHALVKSVALTTARNNSAEVLRIVRKMISLDANPSLTNKDREVAVDILPPGHYLSEYLRKEINWDARKNLVILTTALKNYWEEGDAVAKEDHAILRRLSFSRDVFLYSSRFHKQVLSFLGHASQAAYTS